jgi:hypothetical protein
MVLASLVAGRSVIAANSVAIPVRDPSQPRTLKINLTQGSVHVLGYDGTNIVMATPSPASTTQKNRRARDSSSPESTEAASSATLPGFNIIEQDAEVLITAGLPNIARDLDIRAPRSTAVRFTGVNGSLVVEQLNGDIEAKNLNGEIQLKQISGSVALHSLNGKIQVSFSKVPPDKAMSFSTLTGDIEVTFPVDLQANVKLKTSNGYIDNEFEVRPEARARPTPPKNPQLPESLSPPFMGRTLVGAINGGGPEFQFITHNGNIRIHKGAK